LDLALKKQETRKAGERRRDEKGEENITRGQRERERGGRGERPCVLS